MGASTAPYQQPTVIKGLVPQTSPTDYAAATSNTTTINAVISTPGSYAILPPQGQSLCTYAINSSLYIGNSLSGVTLNVDPGVTIKLAAASNCTMIWNHAYSVNGGAGYNLTGTSGTLNFAAYTIVTTGASTNNQQTLNSVSGMAIGDILTFYVFGNPSIVSITNIVGNVVTLSSAITTTTNQQVNWQAIRTGGGFTTTSNFTTVNGTFTGVNTFALTSVTGMAIGDYLVLNSTSNVPIFIQISNISGNNITFVGSVISLTSGWSVSWVSVNGSPVSWTDQFRLDAWVDLTGTGYTTANVPQGSAITLTGPIVAQGGVIGPIWSTQTFTCTAANATVGAVYTNNGHNFYVQATIAGGTTLTTQGASAALASGTLTKSSGTGDATIAYSAVSAVLSGGTADGAYTGTFFIEQTPVVITSVMVRLRTQPAIGPSTATNLPWQAKSADVDITLTGGVWDPNIQNQTYGPVINRLVGYFLGVYRANVTNMRSLNTGFWLLQASNSCYFANIRNTNHPTGTGGGPGIILMQGACFDLIADNSNGLGMDDSINQQTYWSSLEDVTNFAQFGIGGMGVNTVIRGFRMIGGDILAFPNHPAFPIIGFRIEDCKCEGATGSVGDAPLKIFGPNNADNQGGVSLYDYQVVNFEDNRSSVTTGYDNPLLNITCQGVTPGNNTLNIFNAVLDNIRTPNNPASKTTATVVISNGGGTIDGFLIKNSRFVLNGTVNKQRIVDYTGSYTVKDITFMDCVFVGTTSVGNNLICQSNGTGVLNRVNFIRCKANGCGFFAHGSGASASAANTLVSFRDNFVENYQGFVSFRWSITGYFSGNSWSGTAPGTTFVTVPQTAANSPVLTLSSGGGMTGMPSGKLYSPLAGCFVAFSGNCVDLSQDLAVADIQSTVTGASVTHSNAATLLGTGVYRCNGANWVKVDPVQATILAQTTAQTVTTVTPSVAGTFQLSGWVSITAVATDVLQLQTTYTDENANAQTQTFFPQGLTSANLASTGAFTFPSMTIRSQAGSAITLKVVLTVGAGSAAYDAGGSILQVA